MFFLENTKDFGKCISNLEGSLLCIDYGTSNVGIAISDSKLTVAMPLEVVSPEELIQSLKKYINEQSIRGFVIGLPYNKQFTEVHPIGTKIIALAKEISELFLLPILLKDERMSTICSNKMQNSPYCKAYSKKNKRNLGIRKIKNNHKAKDDHYAAQYVLDGVLDLIREQGSGNR